MTTLQGVLVLWGFVAMVVAFVWLSRGASRMAAHVDASLAAQIKINAHQKNINDDLVRTCQTLLETKANK